jgi:hypothetical protein
MTARTTAVFVDAIESGRARLLLGETAFELPVALLPDGVREGCWLELTATIVPPPSDPNERRRRMGGDDPGGPIRL